MTRTSGDLLETLREHNAQPPSISTNGVRSILKRLCDAGDIEVSGEKEYLTPHEARRGVGEFLYRNVGFEAALFVETERSEYTDDLAGLLNANIGERVIVRAEYDCPASRRVALEGMDFSYQLLECEESATEQ